jgi:hypothetical protein
MRAQRLLRATIHFAHAQIRATLPGELFSGCFTRSSKWQAEFVAIAEARQMVLFDEYTFEIVPSLDPDSRCGWAMALGAMLVVLAWAPIAWLIWTLS